ncbi:hypothetical protein EAF04_003619 [Stromatinia cepivora]|nr:hypothetical protein EAF04_003619 [Stromatinia cepivora]
MLRYTSAHFESWNFSSTASESGSWRGSRARQNVQFSWLTQLSNEFVTTPSSWAQSPKISSSSYNISYSLSAFAFDKIKKIHLSNDICRDLCSLATCHRVAEQDLGHGVIALFRTEPAENRLDTSHNHWQYCQVLAALHQLKTSHSYKMDTTDLTLT